MASARPMYLGATSQSRPFLQPSDASERRNVLVFNHCSGSSEPKAASNIASGVSMVRGLSENPVGQGTEQDTKERALRMGCGTNERAAIVGRRPATGRARAENAK